MAEKITIRASGDVFIVKWEHFCDYDYTVCLFKQDGVLYTRVFRTSEDESRGAVTMRYCVFRSIFFIWETRWIWPDEKYSYEEIAGVMHIGVERGGIKEDIIVERCAMKPVYGLWRFFEKIKRYLSGKEAPPQNIRTLTSIELADQFEYCKELLSDIKAREHLTSI